MKWELMANNYQGKDLFKSVISITNKSNTAVLNNKGWELYFNFTPCRKIIFDSLPEEVKIIHINGDFFKIVPTEKFPILKANETYSFPVIATYLAIKYSDAPGGFYFVFEEAPGKFGPPQTVTNYQVTGFEKKDQLKRNKDDSLALPTPESRYAENLSVNLLSEKEVPLIIPTPYKVDYSDKTITFNPDFEISYDKELKGEADYLQEIVRQLFGKKPAITEGSRSEKNVIALKKGSLPFSKSEEAYELSINADQSINITGNGSAGVFYGIQSLRALMPLNLSGKKYHLTSLPQCKIKDFPQLQYRGMLLDVVRYFHSKESVIKLLEVSSFYKINKLHMHLTDDEGWRLEIKDLPELTEVAGKRGHTLTEEDKLIPAYGDGPNGELGTANVFYSRKDFIDILKYATARHIEIIPEVDLPGHARAPIKAMDARYKKLLAKGDKEGAEKYLLRDLNDKSEYRSVQLFNDNVICPCQEGIYNFIETVNKDIIAMYQEAGAPLRTIHLGGDEVGDGAWEKSPACETLKKNSNGKITSVKDIKTYFLSRSKAILDGQNLTLSVVEDAVMHREHNKVTFFDEFKDAGVNVFSWNNVWGLGSEDISYKMANKGFSMILCHVTNVYFDLAYTNEAEEPVLYWGGFNDTRKAYEYAPYNIYNSTWYDINGKKINPVTLKDKERLTEKGRKNILGIQGMLFSETLKSQQMMEYYTFPKLPGLAERAWAQEPQWAKTDDPVKRLGMLNAQWNVFVNTLGQRELARLDYLGGGVNYRLPVPGAIIENGMLKVNSCFPGLTIRYTTDGTEPTVKPPEYKEPVKVQGTVKVATFSSNGRSSRVSILAGS